MLIGVPGVLNQAIIFVIIADLMIGISLVIFGARRSFPKHKSASIFPRNRAVYPTCPILIGRYFIIVLATSVEVFTLVADLLFEGIVRFSDGICPFIAEMPARHLPCT